MTRHRKTQDRIDAAYQILGEVHPMTVRQLYYRLVTIQVIENKPEVYKQIVNALVDGRKEGIIPWGWIEDRLRMPREVAMWDSLQDFGETVLHAYRRNVWPTQPNYLEVWLEKDALSGIVETVLRPYGVTLNVGRGYDGWSSIHNAAERFLNCGRESQFILYFGDFDPSGEDMVRSLWERLAFFETRPEIVKCAILKEDISRFNLPPDVTKKTDNRRGKFIAEHGDNCVELDALPVQELRRRIRDEMEARMNVDALEQVRQEENHDKERLAVVLGETD